MFMYFILNHTEQNMYNFTHTQRGIIQHYRLVDNVIYVLHYVTTMMSYGCMTSYSHVTIRLSIVGIVYVLNRNQTCIALSFHDVLMPGSTIHMYQISTTM